MFLGKRLLREPPTNHDFRIIASVGSPAMDSRDRPPGGFGGIIRTDHKPLQGVLSQNRFYFRNMPEASLTGIKKPPYDGFLF